MHPFGGTPICPRCSKAVYAAEQIMGPGRKLYHKPCLACTICRKRLDSYNLVEHNQEPYCKTCHVKNFGTRDLRHANLPDRNDVLGSPPGSPMRSGTNLPTHSPRNNAPPLPPRNDTSGGPFSHTRRASPTSPIFRPTRTFSPVRTVSAERNDYVATEQPTDFGATSKHDEDWEPPVISSTPSHTGRSAGGLPRTVPLAPAMTGPPRTTSPTKDSTLPVRVVPTSTGDGATAQGNTIVNGRMSVSLTPKTTGTRYGAALSGGRVASPMAPMAPMATGRQWGGGTPSCGRCGKTVYFAEQVKAIGKTWHRNCLRCTECNHLLDSSRLTENEGNPYCSHCYGKVHGPKGNGYALLGKAGG